MLAIPPLPLQGSLVFTVASNDRGINLELTPIFEEAKVDQTLTLKAESTATGTFQSQVEAWLEGTVGIFIDEVKSRGTVTAGGSVSLSGTLGANQTITAQIKTQKVVGFKIVRAA
jgi:hypothetical protein